LTLYPPRQTAFLKIKEFYSIVEVSGRGWLVIKKAMATPINDGAEVMAAMAHNPESELMRSKQKARAAIQTDVMPEQIAMPIKG
jgi:hypothetical protein